MSIFPIRPQDKFDFSHKKLYTELYDMIDTKRQVDICPSKVKK